MYKMYFWDRTEQGAEVIVEHKPNEDFSGGSNPCDAGVAAERSCPGSAALLETSVLWQHKVRNAKYVFWDLEGSLVRRHFHVLHTARWDQPHLLYC